jgi:hypothetical protein
MSDSWQQARGNRGGVCCRGRLEARGDGDDFCGTCDVSGDFERIDNSLRRCIRDRAYGRGGGRRSTARSGARDYRIARDPSHLSVTGAR